MCIRDSFGAVEAFPGIGRIRAHPDAATAGVGIYGLCLNPQQPLRLGKCAPRRHSIYLLNKSQQTARIVAWHLFKTPRHKPGSSRIHGFSLEYLDGDLIRPLDETALDARPDNMRLGIEQHIPRLQLCLLYTSDAADE